MLLDSRVMTVRKLFRKLHLWLSLPFGLIIMTTCLTGALLVFEKEITELVRHDSYTIPVRKTGDSPSSSSWRASPRDAR